MSKTRNAMSSLMFLENSSLERYLDRAAAFTSPPSTSLPDFNRHSQSPVA
jgi:hypothetical protein